MTPEVAELAMDVFKRYKAAGGRTEHIKVYDDPKEAAEVGVVEDTALICMSVC